MFEAALDGGLQYDAESVDGGYKLCGQVDVTVCNEFSQLTTMDGKVTDLLLNGESPGPRLAVGDGGVVESRSVTAQFLTAYRSIASESLFVTIEVATRWEHAELYLNSATYRAPDGRRRQAADASGPYQLGAESTASIALVFPGAEPGGTVTLDGHAGDDYNRSVDLTMPVG